MANRSSDKPTNRAIVQAYLGAAGIVISADAIHDAEEPLPDVLCTLPDGSRVAFELTQAVDQGVARSINASLAAHLQMRDYYYDDNKLSPEDRATLRGHLGNASVFVSIETGVTNSRFKRVLPALFGLLLRGPHDMEGEIKRDALPKGIERVYIAAERGPQGLVGIHLGKHGMWPSM